MSIEQLMGLTLNHHKYGYVKVIGVISDGNNSKIIVDMDDKSKMFAVSMLPKFFDGVPEHIVSEIQKMNETKPNIYGLKNVKPITLKYCNIDSYGQEISYGEMEYCKHYITNHWFSTNMLPTPVVCDNKKLYINAKAACLDMGIPEVQYSNIYDICNGTDKNKKKFNGHSWRFATEKDINVVLDLMKEND